MSGSHNTSDSLAPLPAAELSKRESEVLAMVAGGLTNAEIAERLSVTVHAVKFHLGAVYRKLRVSNRTEAAIAFVRSSSREEGFQSLPGRTKTP